MKKSLFASLTLGLLALSFSAHAALSNIPGGISVGKSSLGNYRYLTGVAEESREIDLKSIMQGTGGVTSIDGSVITTALYVAAPTNLTLSAAAIYFPAEADTGVARIRVRVPKNYVSSPRLILDCHMAVTYAANVTITATAVQYPVGGLTNTTLVSLTGIFLGSSVSPTSSVNAPTSIAFPVGVTLVPESVVTYQIQKAGALILEVTGARFGFLGGGVIDGQ